MKASKLVVAKAGTNFLCPESSGLEFGKSNIFEDMALQTKQLFRDKIPVVWVSSGAVGFGRKRYRQLGNEFLPNEKREAAGFGARHLLNAWGNAFESYGMDIAQIWVTYEPSGVILNAGDIKEMIIFYVGHGIVPIINYNDVVSGKELELGDNDHLAVEIGNLVNADSLLFLTEKGGVYSLDSAGSLHKRYCEVDAKNLPTCVSEISFGGNGGMHSKLEKAACFYANGIRCVSIANFDIENVLIRFAHGESVGTMIGTSNILYT